MKIALISNMFPPDSDGGLEMNAWKVAHGLRRRGHDVQVLTSQYRPGFTPREPEESWVHRKLKLAPPWSPSWSGVSGKLQLARALLSEVQTLKANRQAASTWLGKQEFDIAYCFGMSLIGPGVTLPFTECGIPVFWHQGGGYLESRFVRAPVESIFLRLRRKWLSEEDSVDLRYVGFVSNHLLTMCTKAGFFEIEGRGTRLQTILPRGVDFPLGTDVERPRTQPHQILMAGRILPIKGFHLAIEAASQLYKADPSLPWELAIVGEADTLDVDVESGGSYLDKLRKQVASSGLEGRVRFLGRKSRPELLELMRNATVFVSASTCGEGFANTIIETLGNGTPLIASIDGATLEVVEPGKSGLVYDAHDIAALAAELLKVLREPQLRHELAQGGVERIASTFTMDRILDRTEETLAWIADDFRAIP